MASGIDSASDREFKSALNRHLNDEMIAEQRGELAETLATILMGAGEEYHPWMFANFEEALGNAPLGERKLFWSCVTEAAMAGMNDNLKNHLALEAMRHMVGNYWYCIAVAEATKRISRMW